MQLKTIWGKKQAFQISKYNMSPTETQILSYKPTSAKAVKSFRNQKQ